MTTSSRIVLVAIGCATAGFLAARPFAPLGAKPAQADGTTASTARKPAREIPLPPLTSDASRLIAEWESLKASRTESDRGTLYADIQAIQDPFRRRAFRSALIAEWASSDPRGALAHLTEKDRAMRAQLIREWLRLDPQAAVSGLLEGGDGTRELLRSVIRQVAEFAPDRLAAVASALKKSESPWDSSTREAFAYLAAKDPRAALQAANSVTGPMRGQALAGIAQTWAAKDAPAALAWAEAIAPGEERDAALRAVLIAWAKTDPMSALDRVDIVPPGGIQNAHATDAGAQILKEAARHDWGATLKWLKENPGKLGQESFDGLMEPLSRQLNRDPAAALRSIRDSSVPMMSMVLANSLLNDGSQQHAAIWDWLDREPSSEFSKSAKTQLINGLAWKNPDLAISYLEKIPVSPENESLFRSGVQSLLNGGTEMDRFESMYETVPEHLRPYMLESAFQFGLDRDGTQLDPGKWIPRLEQLPAEMRNSGSSSMSRAWAKVDPAAAIAWAAGLENVAQRQQAIGGAVYGWADGDLPGAAEWVQSLPPGSDRNEYTKQIVFSLVNKKPEQAWTWALSIEASDARNEGLRSAYFALLQKDSAKAESMLSESGLPKAEMEKLANLKNR